MAQSTPLISLFAGQTTNATGEAKLYSGGTQLAALYIDGTLGGGNITLQAKPLTNSTYASSENPNIGFVNVSGATALDTVEVKLVSMPANCEIRAVLAGSSSANVSVALHYQ